MAYKVDRLRQKLVEGGWTLKQYRHVYHEHVRTINKSYFSFWFLIHSVIVSYIMYTAMEQDGKNVNRIISGKQGIIENVGGTTTSSLPVAVISYTLYYFMKFLVPFYSASKVHNNWVGLRD